MTGVILVIIATAALFGWLLEALHFPAALAAMLTGLTDSPAMVLLLIIIILLIGCVVEVLGGGYRAGASALPARGPVRLRSSTSPSSWCWR